MVLVDMPRMALPTRREASRPDECAVQAFIHWSFRTSSPWPTPRNQARIRATAFHSWSFRTKSHWPPPGTLARQQGRATAQWSLWTLPDWPSPPATGAETEAPGLWSSRTFSRWPPLRNQCRARDTFTMVLVDIGRVVPHPATKLGRATRAWVPWSSRTMSGWPTPRALAVYRITVCYRFVLLTFSV